MIIWFLGFIGILGYAIFNAGMKTKELFYVKKQEYDGSYTKRIMVEAFDGEKATGYGLKAFVVALTWPISLPLIGIFLLGKRFANK